MMITFFISYIDNCLTLAKSEVVLHILLPVGSWYLWFQYEFNSWSNFLNVSFNIL